MYINIMVELEYWYHGNNAKYLGIFIFLNIINSKEKFKIEKKIYIIWNFEITARREDLIHRKQRRKQKNCRDFAVSVDKKNGFRLK